MKQYDTKKLNIAFVLTSSHTEVSEGESFTITLNALGPDVKEGLKIPYRIVGDVRESDYLPSEEYGLFVLDENFTSEVTFKIRSDGFNEEAENFTLTLYYYPEINITTVISRNVIVVVEPPPENTIKNFDYAVIRYKWIDLSGLDLDTKTQVISPYSDIKVGWGENIQYSNYLKWGGDNVNAGVESVLLNLKALKEDNPSYTEEFKISLGGYWFNVRRSGDIILEFQTYLGGTMEQDGFDFINVGGTSVQLIKVATNITSENRFDDPSTMVVKYLIHNRTTNSNRIEDI